MKTRNADQHAFGFDDASIATNYDAILVPSPFAPWAERLVARIGDCRGRRVLDLATGTGIVARKLIGRVGPGGRVIGTDVNREMLDLARFRCAGDERVVEFAASPAHRLPLAAAAVDAVTCQQGFQFFSDRLAAAREVHRVLVPGGSIAASTWRPVEECQYFGWICQALEAVDEPELADLMRAPFDFMPAAELGHHFEKAGFGEVSVERVERQFRIDGDLDDAVAVAYATPIGAALQGLSAGKQDRFGRELGRYLVPLCGGGTGLGKMASNVLTASKPH